MQRWLVIQDGDLKASVEGHRKQSVRLRKIHEVSRTAITDGLKTWERRKSLKSGCPTIARSGRASKSALFALSGIKTTLYWIESSFVVKYEPVR